MKTEKKKKKYKTCCSLRRRVNWSLSALTTAFYKLNNTFSGAECQFPFCLAIKNLFCVIQTVCFFLAKLAASLWRAVTVSQTEIYSLMIQRFA